MKHFFLPTKHSRFFALLALTSTLLLTAATCNPPDTNDKKNPAGSSTNTPPPSAPPGGSSPPPPGPPGGRNPPPPPPPQQKVSAASKAAMDKLDTDLAQAATDIASALSTITDTNKKKAEAQAILANASFKSKLKAKIGTADTNISSIITTLANSLGDQAPASLSGFLDSAVNSADLTQAPQKQLITDLVKAEVAFKTEPSKTKIPGYLSAVLDNSSTNRPLA